MKDDVNKSGLFRVDLQSLFGETFSDSHLKLRLVCRGAADPVDTVVSLWSLVQCQVFLVDIFALSQRHVTHQQQPSAVRFAAQGIFQTGAAGGGGATGRAEDTLKKGSAAQLNEGLMLYWFTMNIISIHFNRLKLLTEL